MASRRVFYSVFMLPIRSRAAIHPSVIVVSRRGRNVMRALRRSVFGIAPRSSSNHRQRASSCLTKRSAFSQFLPVMMRPAPFAYLGQQFLPKRGVPQTPSAPHRCPFPPFLRVLRSPPRLHPPLEHLPPRCAVSRNAMLSHSNHFMPATRLGWGVSITA